MPQGDPSAAALAHAARESGTAVLLITHDAQVTAYADREATVRDGVWEGEPATAGQEASA